MACTQTGLDRLLYGNDSGVQLAGRRVALLANPTTVDVHLNHAADLFEERFNLVALFGPEHGIRGDAQDMIAVDEQPMTASGIPVYSLYGADYASLTPTADSLREVDVLVFDVQDVGSRYYTYVWTMVLAMRACAKAGVDFVVLDRPNPIGGDLVEGGAIEAGYDSFVGLCSVPNRRGLTAGEIATQIHKAEGLDVDLQVVPMQGWQRQMLWAETGLPWVLPSPNMPTPQTALVYPGMCLVEGTEVSEGRGCTRPFEMAGAPYVDPAALAELLGAQNLPGVIFRPLTFRPTFQKWAGQPCGGIQQHITDPREYRPYLTGVAFVWAVHKLYPAAFAWRDKAYEFVDTIPAFDLLTGSDRVRKGIEDNADLRALRATWQSGEEEFVRSRKDGLLY